MNLIAARAPVVVADPPLARFLFSEKRMAPVWFLVRIYVGFAWLDAGWHKMTDTGAATNYIYDGKGILAFWQRIAQVPAGPAKPAIIYDWYRTYIQFMGRQPLGGLLRQAHRLRRDRSRDRPSSSVRSSASPPSRARS